MSPASAVRVPPESGVIDAMRAKAAKLDRPTPWLTGLPVEVIARDCGLGSAANLRKQFGGALATSPQAYRRTFAASSE